LADLLGVTYAGKTAGPIKNSYINFERDTKHEILSGFDDAGRMINTINYADVTPAVYFGKLPLTRVPSYPDLPMEDVFPRQMRTEIADVYLRELGPSRIAYFPGDLERTFWEVLDPDHGRVLANTVHWALNEAPVTTVTGPGVIDVSAWEQDDCISLHLVNLTNAMMMKGPMREIISIGPQIVSIRLPKDRKARDVRLLVGKSSVKFTVNEEVVKLTVPQITDHEVVAVLL
jgi:hypothetical protein